MSARLQHPTRYRFRHYRGDGLLLWASHLGDLAHHGIQRGSALDLEAAGDQPWQENDLFDEGEQDILKVYFRGETAPASFYLRLFKDTPVESDTLATLVGEVTGDDYTGLAVARNTTDWGAPSVAGSGYDVTTATKTFTAGASGWTAADKLVLATAATGTSGLAIAWAELSQERTLGAGDSLAVDLSVKLD